MRPTYPAYGPDAPRLRDGPQGKERGIHSAAGGGHPACGAAAPVSKAGEVFGWERSEGKGGVVGAIGVLRNEFRAPRGGSHGGPALGEGGLGISNVGGTEMGENVHRLLGVG
jgi:hypothetical protein